MSGIEMKFFLWGYWFQSCTWPLIKLY